MKSRKRFKKACSLKRLKMIYELPLFKELNPYAGEIDEKNRWIKLAQLVPWNDLRVIYNNYFVVEKMKRVKDCQLVLGLMIGQILLKQSDRDILEFFHENSYFQYFCGLEVFAVKTEKTIINYSLLSKRRKKLGEKFFRIFTLSNYIDLAIALDATVVPTEYRISK